jgi:tRNA(Arg) A34 adenosine deaminase TadA
MKNKENTAPDMSAGPLPPAPASDALKTWWAKPVGELATVPPPPFSEEEKERHRIYAILLMALVERYWNGNKYGAQGEYPFRKNQRLSGKDGEEGVYLGCRRRAVRQDGDVTCDFDYLGHNIACIAVDGRGEIIDFDFNHNEILDSSVEHAESRLVRRVFSLTQIYDSWATGSERAKREGSEYSNILSDVTIYTSLESCAQCAGIMALAKVKAVVYLQIDPGMYRIGDILYHLTHVEEKPALPSPLPIPAGAFGLSYYDELNRRFNEFRAGLKEMPFFKKEGQKDVRSPSITSFLCTDGALEVYSQGAKELREARLSYGEFAPRGVDRALSNQQALEHALKFYEYAANQGNRGTPHKL